MTHKRKGNKMTTTTYQIIEPQYDAEPNVSKYRSLADVVRVIRNEFGVNVTPDGMRKVTTGWVKHQLDTFGECNFVGNIVVQSKTR